MPEQVAPGNTQFTPTSGDVNFQISGCLSPGEAVDLSKVVRQVIPERVTGRRIVAQVPWTKYFQVRSRLWELWFLYNNSAFFPYINVKWTRNTALIEADADHFRHEGFWSTCIEYLSSVKGVRIQVRKEVA